MGVAEISTSKYISFHLLGFQRATAYMQILLYAVVCLSVRHAGGSVKTVEVRSMQFSPYGSSIPLVFAA